MLAVRAPRKQSAAVHRSTLPLKRHHGPPPRGLGVLLSFCEKAFERVKKASEWKRDPLLSIGQGFAGETARADRGAQGSARQGLALAPVSSSKAAHARETRGIAGALSRHADSVVGSLSPQLQHSARELFLRLVTPQRTGAVVPLSTLQELPNGRDLLEQLVRARLLVIERSERDESTAELAHDSLIQNWGTLARWIDDAGQDLSFLEHLGAAAKLWSANSRDVDLLWRGDMLEDAKRFQKRFRGELSKAEQAFLDDALALEAKAVRRRRRMAAVSMAFLALLVATSFVALAVIASSRLEAQRQARAAEQAAVEAKRQADMAKRAEETATREAAAAAAAEAQARERLAEVQEKERERAGAAARAEKAMLETKRANDRLKAKNGQLVAALSMAEASSKAERRAKEEARRHHAQAVRAAKDLELALRREKERVQRLQNQIGSVDLTDIVE